MSTVPTQRRPASGWTWCSWPRWHHYDCGPADDRKRDLVDGASRPSAGPGAAGHADISMAPTRAPAYSAIRSTVPAGLLVDLVQPATPTSARHRPHARPGRRRRRACRWTSCSRPRRHLHATDSGTAPERDLVNGPGRPSARPGAAGRTGTSNAPDQAPTGFAGNPTATITTQTGKRPQQRTIKAPYRVWTWCIWARRHKRNTDQEFDLDRDLVDGHWPRSLQGRRHSQALDVALLRAARTSTTAPRASPAVTIATRIPAPITDISKAKQPAAETDARDKLVPNTQNRAAVQTSALGRTSHRPGTRRRKENIPRLVSRSTEKDMQTAEGKRPSCVPAMSQ